MLLFPELEEEEDDDEEEEEEDDDDDDDEVPEPLFSFLSPIHSLFACSAVCSFFPLQALLLHH